MGEIIQTSDLVTIIPELKKKGKVVLIGGCFDILHKGHIQFLHNAKLQGDILVLQLESDESIRKSKGKKRPVNSQLQRAENILKTNIVDYVLLLPELKTNEDYYEMTNLIQPDIIAVTKGDPALNHKLKQAEDVGGEVIEVIERLHDYSTTAIINRT